MTRTALVPGTFDPFTNGHLDLVGRAATLFDAVVVAILVNPRKTPERSADARAAAIRAALAGSLPGAADRVRVVVAEELTVTLARRLGATHLVRGVRSGAELDAELAMAHVNRRLDPAIDTVLLPTGREVADLSATLVREVAAHGGDISAMVPPEILRHLQEG